MGAGVPLTRWDRVGPLRLRALNVQRKELEEQWKILVSDLKDTVNSMTEENKNQVFDEVMSHQHLFVDFCKMMKKDKGTDSDRKLELSKIPYRKLKYLLTVLLDKQ